MVYDVNLGILATQAITELTRATSYDEPDRYQLFLQKSAEFCRSVRESLSQMDLQETGPDDAARFLSAVMNSAGRPSSTSDAYKLRQVGDLEPIIEQILHEHRQPTDQEQLRIAELLYAASSADVK
ncbi:MAG: hypothetical protein LAP39_02690 [Acidobacteriia bacterium]|nr:hypothetical protein [Terriglobia bacterium]